MIKSLRSRLDAPLHHAAAVAIRGRLALGQIGRGRLLAAAACVAMALCMALFGWSLPLLDEAERGLYDLRAWITAPVVEQDHRIVLVVFNEDTVRVTGHRSPVDRGLLARALARLDGMGAKAIGVDILFDQSQHEDQDLIAALRNLRTPTRLGFASSASNPDNVEEWQQTFEQDFLGRVERTDSALSSASVRIEPDADTVVRRWPGPAPGDPPLLSVSLAGPDAGPRAVSPAMRWRRVGVSPLSPPDDDPLYVRIPIQHLDDGALAGRLGPIFRGKYVLVGAQLSDADRKKTPATLLTGETTSGLEIHADMLAQVLDRDFPAPAPAWSLFLAAIAVVGAGGLSGLVRTRLAWSPVVFGGQALIWIIVPPLAQQMGVDTGTLPQFGWLSGWLLAYMAVASAARSVSAEQRRVVQIALGKYLPRDVAEEIIKDPSKIALHGDRRTIYALFTDLQDFTELSHSHPPEKIAALLNGYLDLVSRTVLQHGGTLDKFVGDSVVAFWGAPISRPDDGERAARAAIAIWRVGEAFRTTPPTDLPALGRTRVGLHHGEAVVGNFGGEMRIQYTALGDVMNTASRLEGANKPLETRILISREAAAPTVVERLRPMGRIVVRGRPDPVEVLEPALDFPEAARARLWSAWQAFEDGDAGALDDIRALADSFSDDPALANLVRRLGAVGPGGAFRLT